MSARAVPENADIEGNILGTVLLDPSLLDEAPPIAAADFYWEHHQAIWRIVVDLRKAGRQPSEATVRDEIAARGWADRTAGRDQYGNLINGDGYLSVLARLAYQPEFANSIIKLLELSRCRRGIDACYRLAKQLEAGAVDSAAALRDGGEYISGLADSLEPDERATTLAQFAQDEANRIIESYHHTAQRVSGASTGIEWVTNAMCGGFKPDQLIIVGARPGTGKTKISLYMLAAAALSGYKVGMVSLDMGRDVLMPYITPPFASLLGGESITARQVANPTEDGELGEARLLGVCANLDPHGMCRIISDPRSFTLASVSGYIRHLVKQGCQIIMLDQLQDISEWADGYKDRGLYNKIFHELRIMLARRYHITLIALHQIGRSGTDRPKLSDLKDSGCSEEFIDFAILLHDYQSTLIQTNGGFIMDGDRARAPKEKDIPRMLTKAISRRLISIDLAKTRSSAVERHDCWFDFSLGIAGE